MGGSPTMWLVLAMAALVAAVKKGWISLPSMALSKSAPASLLSGGSPPAERLDEIDPATEARAVLDLIESRVTNIESAGDGYTLLFD